MGFTGERTTLAWDYENRLTAVALPAGARNTFLYDADGRRVRKEDSAGTSKFLWDREVVLLETDGSDVTQVVYTLEPVGYGNLLSQRRAATRFYHFDGVGSTDRLTDSSAVVTDTQIYEAFGSLKAGTGSTVNPYRFVGQTGYQSNADIPQLYLRERYYDPRLIRFIGPDFLYAENGNPYLYVFNRPVIFIDPSGLQLREVIEKGKEAAKAAPAVATGAAIVGAPVIVAGAAVAVGGTLVTVGAVKVWRWIFPPPSSGLFEALIPEVAKTVERVVREVTKTGPTRPPPFDRRKKWKWKCSTIPRGVCPAQCLAVFVGYGLTKEAAIAASEGACQAAGCHTPGGSPFNCNCGHTHCIEAPN